MNVHFSYSNSIPQISQEVSGNISLILQIQIPNFILDLLIRVSIGNFDEKLGLRTFDILRKI